MDELNFLTRSEICQNPMKEPKYLRALVEKDDLEFLRKFAFERDTVVSEVVRVIIREFVEKAKFTERTAKNK